MSFNTPSSMADITNLSQSPLERTAASIAEYFGESPTGNQFALHPTPSRVTPYNSPEANMVSPHYTPVRERSAAFCAVEAESLLETPPPVVKRRRTDTLCKYCNKPGCSGDCMYCLCFKDTTEEFEHKLYMNLPECPVTEVQKAATEVIMNVFPVTTRDTFSVDIVGVGGSMSRYPHGDFSGTVLVTNADRTQTVYAYKFNVDTEAMNKFVLAINKCAIALAVKHATSPLDTLEALVKNIYIDGFFVTVRNKIHEDCAIHMFVAKGPKSFGKTFDINMATDAVHEMLFLDYELPKYNPDKPSYHANVQNAMSMKRKNLMYNKKCDLYYNFMSVVIDNDVYDDECSQAVANFAFLCDI